MSYEIIEIEKICRTCLSTGNNMRSLFSIDETIGITMRLSEMLISCASVQVMENDGLPNQVCLQCVCNITNTFSFKQLCKRSENTLRGLLNRPVGATILEQKPLLKKEVIEIISTVTKTLPSETEPLIKTITKSIEYDNDSLAITTNELNMREYEEKIEIKYNEIKTEILQNDTDSDACQDAKLKMEVKYEMEPKTEASEDETDQPIYACDKCTCCFTTEADLKDHGKTHFKVSHHICKICNKSFASAASLGNHKVFHKGFKPHLCSVCGKGFARSTDFNRHMGTHTGEKKYHCKLCGESFRESFTLLEHMRAHENKKSFICSVCDKAFSRYCSFVRHQKTHTSKLQECGICGKRLHGSLALHMKIHMELKNYQCPLCGKGFTTRKYLSAHKKRTHMVAQGLTKHKCSFCNKGFYVPSRLKRHLRIHNRGETIDV